MKHKPLNTELKKYIVDIESYLICDWRTKNRFIRDLKNDIIDFVDENENVTMDDIRKRFGEPQDIAKGFLENVDLKKIKRRMNIGGIIAIGIAVALFIWAAGVTTIIIDAHSSNEGYFVDEVHDTPENQITVDST